MNTMMIKDYGVDKKHRDPSSTLRPMKVSTSVEMNRKKGYWAKFKSFIKKIIKS